MNTNCDASVHIRRLAARTRTIDTRVNTRADASISGT
jgi:hypothetical protein